MQTPTTGTADLERRLRRREGLRRALTYLFLSIWAVVVLMFTMAIVLKWSRCPWCGELIIKKLFSIKECPSCGRDLETGKKKKGKGGRK